jgi:hypothetical protein
MSDLTYNELKGVVNDAMRSCLRSLESGDALEARTEAVKAVDACRHGLNGGGAAFSGNEKSKTLYRGILAAACRDLSDCDTMMQQDQLPGDKLESLWNRLLICIERLAFVRGKLDGVPIEDLADRATMIREKFDARFGAGLYANPEFIVRRELCSICNDDFRRCSHRDLRVYDGVLCRRIPKDVTVRAVSFVKQPTDLRCRVWPWRWDEQAKKYSFEPILDSSNLDDLSDPSEI